MMTRPGNNSTSFGVRANVAACGCGLSGPAGLLSRQAPTTNTSAAAAASSMMRSRKRCIGSALLLGRAGCFGGFCASKSSGRKATIIEVPVTPGPGVVARAPGLNLLPNCWCFLWTGVEGKRWYACLHFLTRTSRLRPAKRDDRSGANPAVRLAVPPLPGTRGPRGRGLDHWLASHRLQPGRATGQIEAERPEVRTPLVEDLESSPQTTELNLVGGSGPAGA